MTSPPATFAVVGTGWRCEFFLRLAAAAPQRLRVVGVVSRSGQRGEAVTRTWGVPAHRSIDDLLRHERPDVLVAAVPREVSAATVRELAGTGGFVLAETPPAADLGDLRALWADVGASGRVAVAEQYLRMPAHAARLALVGQGLVGEVTSVQVSSTHDYHAVALIRGLLGIGRDDVTVSARAFTAPLQQPLSPAGWDAEAGEHPSTTTLGVLDWGGGRHGLYDFTDNQWWNPLRSRRVLVRGTAGEIADDTVTRMAEPVTPVTSHLLARRLGIDLNLEGVDLDHYSLDGRVVYRNAWKGTRLSEDDIAVADLLAAAGSWARDDASCPYPLGDGCHDHAVALAMHASARTGTEVTVRDEPWQTSSPKGSH